MIKIKNRITIRCTEEQYAIWEEDAFCAGIPLDKFMRIAANNLSDSIKTIKKQIPYQKSNI